MIYDYLSELKDCAICPRECHADRINGKAGYCNSDYTFNIAAVCTHTGEEPVISGKNGICNVFFANCNMNCKYCQNYQISHTKEGKGYDRKPDEVVAEISAILDTGIDLLGFVSPSHYIPQMKAVIFALNSEGRKPVVVYNTNACDKAETLKTLENIVDVYLPDFKYSDAGLAKKYSDAENYPQTAVNAIKEMVRQKGTSLRLNDKGQVESGVIIRHLVLPGYVDNSLDVLRMIADSISPYVHISLMSQYFPAPDVANDPDMGRTITKEEYETVVNEMESHGLFRGWLQEHKSNEHYRPDFMNKHPFA